ANTLKAASTALPPRTLAGAHAHLEQLVAFAQAAVNDEEGTAGASAEASEWARALLTQCEAALAELCLLAPWSTLPATGPGMRDLTRIAAIPSLRQIASLDAQPLSIVALDPATPLVPADREGRLALQTLVAEGSQNARDRLATLAQLEAQISELALMEYDFLFDQARRQLSIGYSV